MQTLSRANVNLTPRHSRVVDLSQSISIRGRFEANVHIYTAFLLLFWER